MCKNICGDLVNAVANRHYRPLIGLPIAAALIAYLARQLRSSAGASTEALANPSWD